MRYLLALLCVAPLMGQSIAAGQHQFALSCSVGYCHGVGGSAGRGPRLRDRDWDRSYLYKTIQDGIPGSGMPAWKDRLSSQQIADIVSYILSISHEVGKGGAEPLASATPAQNGLAVSAGRALFFDPTNDRNCGVCHRVADSGASIGPALDKLGASTEAQIVAAILKPAGGVLLIHTVSAEDICGIKAGEDSKLLEIYDLGSDGPPVLRTVSKERIVKRGSCENLPVHAGLTLDYTPRQLSEIAAFLRARQ